MSGRKWVGRSGFYFIFLFNLTAHFCFSIIDFIYIHNGKRKLKFATVSANLADCQFLFCFVTISWKMLKKVYRRRTVESSLGAQVILLVVLCCRSITITCNEKIPHYTLHSIILKIVMHYN